MSQLNLTLALIGGLVLAVSLGTGLLQERSYLPSEPLIGLAFGVVVGPHGVGLLQLTPWGGPFALLEQVARLTIALAVTSIALRLPPAFFLGRARSLATLVGPVMIGMWLASSLVAYLALPVPVTVALLVGAIVTPTDPVLANSIVVGETAKQNIPKRVRFLLSGEAGINDGVAYLFVFLPVLLLAHPVETALVDWVTGTLLYEVVGAVVLGAVIGGVVGRGECWASSERFLDETSVLTVTVALTFAVLGAVKLVGSDGILAVFVAGVAYNWQADVQDESEQQQTEEVFNRLFTLPIFVFFGMALPVAEWVALGWRAPALVVGILLIRRLPVILAVRPLVRPLDRLPAALFVGWFGPIGVAAIFYGTLSVRATGSEFGWVAASLIVTGSVLAHGMTATPLTHRYGRLGDEDDSW